ncbi:MAG TPA: hypothetical protein VNP04_30430 [Alphaproteobacteria bacterium]|nr:hypothetical protein [Alphaproteobacteria bacterium]
MPKDDFDQEDPFELVGMLLPGPQDDTAFELMGRCFVEEFVRMGWDATQIFLLFQDPFYRGPHLVYQAKGERFVHDLIAHVRREWSGDDA